VLFSNEKREKGGVKRKSATLGKKESGMFLLKRGGKNVKEILSKDGKKTAIDRVFGTQRKRDRFVRLGPAQHSDQDEEKESLAEIDGAIGGGPFKG